MKFKGTPGNDVIAGTTRDDRFIMTQGGDDIVSGKGGDDTFVFGAAFNATDRINGGFGYDILKLNGNYSGTHSVTFNTTTLTNVEAIQLAGHHSYTLVTNDSTIAAGKSLTVNGIRLGSSDSLHFDGSNETDGNFVIFAGVGDDVLKGGGGDNFFHLGQGGDDIVYGGNGLNIYYFGANLALGDMIHGSGTLVLGSDYPILKFSHNGIRLTNGDYAIVLKGNHDYELQFKYSDSRNIGQLVIDGSKIGAAGHLTFSGTGGETGTTLIGGAGADGLHGGWGSAPTTITGGGGADFLFDEGNGNVAFVYNQASDSTSLGFDTIEGFNANGDFFKLPGSPSITVDSPITSGRLDSSTFDTDIQNAVVSIANDHAVLFHPDSGDESGSGVAFLIVNIDGTPGYQAGSDLVMEIFSTVAGELTGFGSGNFT